MLVSRLPREGKLVFLVIGHSRERREEDAPGRRR
jgi:hypothetical protein